jgi:hypothetical protein
MNDNVLQQTLGVNAMLRSQAACDDHDVTFKLHRAQQALHAAVTDLWPHSGQTPRSSATTKILYNGVHFHSKMKQKQMDNGPEPAVSSLPGRQQLGLFCQQWSSCTDCNGLGLHSHGHC